MLIEKFKGKKVGILRTSYGGMSQQKGIVTKMDSEWIELDNNLTIPIKYIIEIKEI